MTSAPGVAAVSRGGLGASQLLSEAVLAAPLAVRYLLQGMNPTEEGYPPEMGLHKCFV